MTRILRGIIERSIGLVSLEDLFFILNPNDLFYFNSSFFTQFTYFESLQKKYKNFRNNKKIIAKINILQKKQQQQQQKKFKNEKYKNNSEVSGCDLNHKVSLGDDVFEVKSKIFKSSDSIVVNENSDDDGNWIPNNFVYLVKNYSIDEMCFLHLLSFSLLVMKSAVQFDIDDSLIPFIFKIMFPTLDYKSTSLNFHLEKKLKFFGIKREKSEGRKTNIFFSDVSNSLKKKNIGLWEYFNSISGNMKGFTNDQASSALIWADCNFNDYGIKSAEYAIQIVKYPIVCKTLNIIIKSSGSNIKPKFSKLTEAYCLQGMSIDDGILKDAVSRRLKKDFHDDVVHFNSNELRSVVRKILLDEIDIENYEYIDSDKLWNERWGWFVNGSHNNNISLHEEKWKIKTDERMYRRSCSENIDFNPIDNFDGRVYVGSSFKKEIGKSGRTICSCDTQSYTAFHHLLSPVEKCWRGNRVILDPGKLGNGGTCQEVRNLRQGINVMLDYDEFDMQHQNLAQQIVIDELCEILNFPVKYRKNLVESFDRSLLHCNGITLGYTTHSLMSGHRGTTFINSVLNASYIRMSCGDRIWKEFDSRHTGDDVVGTLNNLEDLSYLLDNMKKFNIRMNPMKQSIGYISKEFLRICINDKFSIGYFCRTLGRSISGNWETPKILDNEQFLNTWLSNGRSLINRSFNVRIGDLLSSSMSKSTGIKIKICSEMLKGKIGVGNGPVYSSNGYWCGYEIIDRYYKDKNDNGVRGVEEIIKNKSYKTCATDSYLVNKATVLEQEVYSTLGLSPIPYMLNASYARNQCLEGLTSHVSGIVLGQKKVVRLRTLVVYESEVFSKKSKNKILTLYEKYPLLNFVKNNINKTMLYEILKKSILTEDEKVKTLEEKVDGGNYIKGFLSYADASSIKRNNSIVTVLHQCFI